MIATYQYSIFLVYRFQKFVYFKRFGSSIENIPANYQCVVFVVFVITRFVEGFDEFVVKRMYVRCYKIFHMINGIM